MVISTVASADADFAVTVRRSPAFTVGKITAFPRVVSSPYVVWPSYVYEPSAALNVKSPHNGTATPLRVTFTARLTISCPSRALPVVSTVKSTLAKMSWNWNVASPFESVPVWRP